MSNRNRNGTLGDAPRVIQSLAMGNKAPYLLPAADYGPIYTRAVTSNYERYTGEIAVMQPMIVSAIKWDVRIADTYICRFVTTLAGTTSLKDINTSVVVGAPGTATIVPTDGDFIMTPGVYFLQLITHDSAHVEWWDYYSATVHSFTTWYNDTTSVDDAPIPGTLPIRFTALAVTIPNLTAFERM